MQTNISLSGGSSDYLDLCDVDRKIRESEHSSLEWTPAMIFANDESLVYPKRYRNLLKRRLGLEEVSGPFFDNHFYNGKEMFETLPQ